MQFYASWCEHSNLAIPEFVQVLQYIADNNITGVFLGKIDVTKHGGRLCIKLLVLQYLIFPVCVSIFRCSKALQDCFHSNVLVVSLKSYGLEYDSTVLQCIFL